MQGKKIEQEYVLLSVPAEALEESGIKEGSLLQITTEKGKIHIETVNDLSDFVCDGDCENCPINETDCDGDCDNCPCNNICEEE